MSNTRFAVEPQHGLGFCVPLDIELMEWMGGPPGVSWSEYRAIRATAGLRAWWVWRRGAYDHRAFAYAAAARQAVREQCCYCYQGVQVHFCEHTHALGLRPQGAPGPIPDAFRDRVRARASNG